MFRALQSGSWNHRGLWGQAATCRALVPGVAGSWCEVGGVRPGPGSLCDEYMCPSDSRAASPLPPVWCHGFLVELAFPEAVDLSPVTSPSDLGSE